MEDLVNNNLQRRLSSKYGKIVGKSFGFPPNTEELVGPFFPNHVLVIKKLFLK